jgi:D-alanyl-D-alanine carboxypeptidase
MIALSRCRMGLRGLSVAILVLLPLSGCAGESSGGGDTQADGSDTVHLTDANVQAVNDLIAQEMEDKNLPGVVVGVWTPDEGEYVTAQGTANLDTGRAREPEDSFRIASITKTFTGTAVLQLVDKGQLNTSDKLSTWYPEFPNADEITVDDLLRMRSGIVDPFDEDFLQMWIKNPTMDFSPEDAIAASAARADEFEPPNEKTEYNNLNFVFLQEIVGKVSGNDLGG